MILIEAYRTKERKQWEHTRMIAYCNMVASWQNPKRRPPSITRYMNLDPNELSSDEYVEERMNRLEELQKQYAMKVKSKKDIN